MTISNLTADTLQDIKHKGKLVIGVKADFAPWGFRNEKGTLVGMEIDMAADLARQLGVKLELVPVLSSNRLQFLNDRKIDLIIATMSVTAEREKIVGIVKPYYYATIIGLLASNTANIHSERQLAGKKICILEGSYFDNCLLEMVKGPLLKFPTIPEIENALLQGACDGFAFDDVYLLFKVKSQPQTWMNFHIIQLLTLRPAAWAIAVRKEDLDQPWGLYLSKVLSEWHRSGKLLALEKKWVGEKSMALKLLSGQVKSEQNGASKTTKAAETIGTKTMLSTDVLHQKNDLVGYNKSEIDTPALLVDLDILEASIRRIAETCRKNGVDWRPHCKTHKLPAIAKMQIEAGAVGITCAKLSEAETMAAAGINNILVANQIVGTRKIARLLSLARRANITVAVDSEINVAMLAEAAAAANIVLQLVIEVNVGVDRAGVSPGEAVLRLAREIMKHPSLQLLGLFAWEGHTTTIEDPVEKSTAITDALGKLTSSADLCRRHDIPIRVVSCGGTGTFETAAAVPGVTEIQAGGGVFGDVRYRAIYNVNLPYGLTVLSTVTSRPTESRIICDAGKKALSIAEGVPIPRTLGAYRSIFFSAEHAKIELDQPSGDPAIGTQVEFVVGYADTTMHMHTELYGVRQGIVEKVWSIPSEAKLT